VAAPAHSASPAGRPAFDGWVTARGPAMIRFAYVLTGQLGDADEVVQEALASVYAHWDRFAGSDRLEQQVQMLIVRAYLSGARWRRGTRPEGAGDLWLPTPNTGDSPDTDACGVWWRCAQLPRRQRAALVLSCYEGLDVPEIARLMGLRERSVRGDLEQALVVAIGGSEQDADESAPNVGRALREYAELAPPSYTPADRAVLRARRRRWRRAFGVTAAAAVAVPAVWVGLGGGTPPDRPPRPLAADTQPGPLDLSGWRWESWGGVQVRVPGRWGHGDLTQWCATRGPDGPAVDRPELDSTHASCSLRDDGRATYTSGLLLRRTEDDPRLSRADVAPYATARIHTVGGVTLTVVDIDPRVGSAILSSAEVVGRRDFNGCAPHRPPGRAGRTIRARNAVPVADIGEVAQVSVCRYGLVGWPRPTLISSHRLTGAAADSTLAALRAAPARSPSRATGPCRTAATELAVLELWRGGHPSPVLVRYDGCRGHGLDDGYTTRALTHPVLEPILVPPWTGELSADVARPRPRR
jgi:DNA-directed RNA polymerase specialized sigma24 family protein